VSSVIVDPYIPMAKIAKVCGWTTRYTRRFMIRARVAVQVGGDWYVPDDALMDQLPAIYTRLYESKAFGDSESHVEPSKAT